MTTLDWTSGTWTTAPAATNTDGDHLLVEAVEGSDAWRTTSYGFVHDTEHALLAPLSTSRAVEVTFIAPFEAQFDQAGLFLKAADDVWIKAGVEFADGVAQVGAVVTNPASDWSMAPVPTWPGRPITIRASRCGNAVTIRARVEGEPWRLVRVAPFPATASVQAGPYCCAPTRAGFVVRFTSWVTGPADDGLHD